MQKESDKTNLDNDCKDRKDFACSMRKNCYNLRLGDGCLKSGCPYYLCDMCENMGDKDICPIPEDFERVKK